MTNIQITAKPTAAATTGTTTAAATTVTTSTQAEVTATYTVTGMTCEHCVASVTEELSTVDGVASVSVSLADGQVTVVSDRPLAEPLVRAAVEEAGYQLA
jgi:copper chaperone